jgi:GT2 family glycosyltransferase
MNAGERPYVPPDLSDRLAELERERRRLSEVTHAYRVVEQSAFAKLRLLGSDALALLGRSRKERKRRPATLVPSSETANGNDDLESDHLLRAPVEPYSLWLQNFGPREVDFQRMRDLVPLLPRRPLISVIVPTYNTPELYLRAAIESVRAQVYPDWELCIADDASPDSRVRRTLEEYAALDPRIKLTLRAENGHISRATNSALETATGEFVAFLDHDDLITRDALFECALIVNRIPDVDMIYSDEDKIDDTGTLREPFFKPDWNPDRFLSQMYTCHFGVYRRSLVESLGGLRPEFNGSQDYDLVLRLTERTTRIHHIPKILYHWRIHPGSVTSSSDAKPYAYDAAERAIGEAIERRGEPGRVYGRTDLPGHYIVRYKILDRKKVSVIIPTRNHGEDVDHCLKSIFAKTTYDDFEIVLLDNGSNEKASLDTFQKWAKYDRRIKLLRYDVPFNFSKINNYAVAHSDGHYVLLLNNDTEVISGDWMEAMVEQAQRPSIGAVGALLLYPDDTVQHAGVILGIGGVAGHSHKGFPSNAPGYFATLCTVNNFSAVTGACLMVRRSVYDQVGGLDEELTVALNDVDFCLKIREAGYRNVYLPHVKLYHFESKSRGYELTPEKLQRFEGERRMMMHRWKTDVTTDPYYSPNLTLDGEDFAIRTR